MTGLVTFQWIIAFTLLAEGECEVDQNVQSDEPKKSDLPSPVFKVIIKRNFLTNDIEKLVRLYANLEKAANNSEIAKKDLSAAISHLGKVYQWGNYGVFRPYRSIFSRIKKETEAPFGYGGGTTVLPWYKALLTTKRTTPSFWDLALAAHTFKEPLVYSNSHVPMPTVNPYQRLKESLYIEKLLGQVRSIDKSLGLVGSYDPATPYPSMQATRRPHSHHESPHDVYNSEDHRPRLADMLRFCDGPCEEENSTEQETEFEEDVSTEEPESKTSLPGEKDEEDVSTGDYHEVDAEDTGSGGDDDCEKRGPHVVTTRQPPCKTTPTEPLCKKPGPHLDTVSPTRYCPCKTTHGNCAETVKEQQPGEMCIPSFPEYHMHVPCLPEPHECSHNCQYNLHQYDGNQEVYLNDSNVDQSVFIHCWGRHHQGSPQTTTYAHPTKSPHTSAPHTAAGSETKKPHVSKPTHPPRGHNSQVWSLPPNPDLEGRPSSTNASPALKTTPIPTRLNKSTKEIVEHPTMKSSPTHRCTTRSSAPEVTTKTMKHPTACVDYDPFDLSCPFMAYPYPAYQCACQQCNGCHQIQQCCTTTTKTTTTKPFCLGFFKRTNPSPKPQKIIVKISPSLGEVPVVIMKDSGTSGVALSLVSDLFLDENNRLCKSNKKRARPRQHWGYPGQKMSHVMVVDRKEPVKPSTQEPLRTFFSPPFTDLELVDVPSRETSTSSCHGHFNPPSAFQILSRYMRPKYDLRPSPYSSSTLPEKLNEGNYNPMWFNYRRLPQGGNYYQASSGKAMSPIIAQTKLNSGFHFSPLLMNPLYPYGSRYRQMFYRGNNAPPVNNIMGNSLINGK